MPPILIAQNISKRFGANLLFENISFCRPTTATGTGLFACFVVNRRFAFPNALALETRIGLIAPGEFPTGVAHLRRM
jgi:hypothetical protein